MKTYSGYLIDLDGTMYRGNQVIEGAKEFIEWLHERKVPHLFVTNNSAAKPQQILDRLRRMDIHAEEGNIFTSAMAAADYMISEYDLKDCYAIGEEGLFDALEEAGLVMTESTPQAVVMGIDRNITYGKMSKASNFIRHGALFFSTNNDVVIPVEGGIAPGNGALSAAVATAGGRDPICIGKPAAIIMEQALRKLGVPREEVIMVGDNYETDIKAGIHADIDTLMVYSGVSDRAYVANVSKKPDYQIDRLTDWFNE